MERSDHFNWVHVEKDLPQKGIDEVRFSRDKPGGTGAKCFAFATPEAIYSEIRRGYDNGAARTYYEFRDPNKKCNFYVDIDDVCKSEEAFDKDAYLARIRDDFNTAGITEAWKVQSSCGQKGERYKISFHITIPGVVFESHKHLKAWLKEKCEIQQVSGTDKNGKRKTQTIWKLGTTPIDWKVYQKGDWRYPLCAKEGSKRILKYDEEISFEVFQKLSIHYIEPGARQINVQLNECTKKRKNQVVLSGALTNEDKERFNLQGNLEWYLVKHDGQLARAMGPWRCPFQVEHFNNKTVKVKSNAVYCFGCDKEFSLTKRGKFHELPMVPDLLPVDLFMGTDEAYAKMMLTLYGDNFVYTRRLYFWNGDLWCDGEDQAYYTIESLYTHLSLQLEDYTEPTGELPAFDEVSLQQARVACTEKEQVLDQLKRELSDLKREHLEAIRRYEQDILDAEDATELKEEKALFRLKQQSEQESKKAEVKLAHSAMETAHKTYQQRRAEYKQHKKNYEQKQKEQKTFQAKLSKQKGELRTLQSNTRKKKIVDEFRMQCKRYLKISVEMDVNEAQRGLFHFKNGCIDLHTGEFRTRRKNDFVTKSLPYCYHEVNEELQLKMGKIQEKLRMVQPTDEGYRWTMDWLGYNLTGYTKEQKFNLFIGYTASNAKSSLFDLMTSAFPIYVHPMGNKAFDDKNQNFAKNFGCLLDNAYRMVWMNEWGKKVIDEDRFCNFVDGKPFPIPVIYEKAEIMITPHCKLTAASNNDPNIKGGTKGTFRRGVQTPFTSQFVDDGSENESLHRYKDDKGQFAFKFKDDSYKLAFFHLLLPHAVSYCEKGLSIPQQYRDAFKRNIEDRDPFSEVFDVFLPTRDPEDMVSKKAVMNWMEQDSTLAPWQKKFGIVLQKFKSKGIAYDSQKVVTIGGVKTKGWFTQVRRHTFRGDT